MNLVHIYHYLIRDRRMHTTCVAVCAVNILRGVHWMVFQIILLHNSS